MLYNLFGIFALIIAFLPLCALSFKKKFRKSIRARFFLWKNPKFKPCKLHIHACSYGEVKACEFLIKNISDCVVTTTTQTGFDLAKKLGAQVRFLPFEPFLPLWLEKSRVLVVFEAELWLNLVKTAKKNGSFVILLNARITDRSHERYLKAKFYYKKVFANIDLVLAQRKTDKIRLELLGAKNVQILGNLKSAIAPNVTKIYTKFSHKLIILASTHKGEESLILRHLRLKNDETLIIAPRHPERFNEVDKIARNFGAKYNLSYEKFSQNLGLKSRVILLDTLGELVNFYKIADITVLCGSFIKGIGGHNPIEIAYFGKILLSGKFIENHYDLFSCVENCYFCDADEIDEILHSNLKSSKIINRANIDEISTLITEKLC